MKRARMMKKVVLVLFLVTMVAAIQADLVVDYNPVPTWVSGRSPDVSTLNGDTWAFSDTTPMVASAGGQNDAVYGGVISTWSVETESTPYVRNINWSGGGFEVQNNPANGSSTSLKGAYVWNKADFISGSSETLGFESGDSISYSFSWITLYNQDLRMVVKQGGSYYVSSWYTTGGSASMDPTLSDWAVLDTADYTWGAYEAVSLDDIEAVGVYFSINTGAVIDQTATRLADFQVNATVVPEPMTMVLMGLGAMVLRRRK